MAHTFAAAEVLTAANLGARINWTDWTAVTFQNSWVDFGSSNQAVQYRKIGDRVYVRGVMKSGSSATVAFTLPSGFRPPAILRLPGSDATTVIIVGTDGTVTIYSTDTSVAGLMFDFSVTA